jgi:1-acyl-sn-glycerol-3-phosphate acyltransferase
MLGRAQRDVCSRRIIAWAEGLVRLARVEIEVSGLEHAATDETFVVMSNHQSLYDIPVLFQALNRPMRMVAKKELFRIPFFGHAMTAAEFVRVDRGNRRQAFEAIDRAKELVESGLDVWIAPEGTRSKDGGLGEFKRGGFHLALGTGARILPVSLAGTRQVMPTSGLRIVKKQGVRVAVSPPIDPNDFGKKRLPELVEAVRTAIAAHL